MPIIFRGGTVGLFVHIPKTAGTSIEAILKEWTKVGFLNQSPVQQFAVSPQHMTISDINHFFKNDFFDFSFSVCRHPLERIKSEYYGHHGSADDNIQKITEWWEKSSEIYSSNQSVYDNHLLPQKKFLEYEQNGEQRQSIDIFKLEEGLDPVKQYLANKLHIPYEALQHNKKLNKSSKPKQVDWGVLEQKILNFYSEDMDYLGYE